jgi:hypothetical protein
LSIDWYKQDYTFDSHAHTLIQLHGDRECKPHLVFQCQCGFVDEQNPSGIFWIVCFLNSALENFFPMHQYQKILAQELTVDDGLAKGHESRLQERSIFRP